MPIIDIRAHGGKLGGGGYKPNFTKELAFISRQYAPPSRTTTNTSPVLAYDPVNDYVAVRKDYFEGVSTVDILKAKDGTLVRRFTPLNGGYAELYANQYLGAFHGDWFYHMINASNVWKIERWNVVTGVRQDLTADFGSTRYEHWRVINGCLYATAYNYIIKYNSDGSLAWRTTIPGPTSGGGRAVIAVKDGRVFVGSNTSGYIWIFNDTTGANLNTYYSDDGAEFYLHGFVADDGSIVVVTGNNRVHVFSFNPSNNTLTKLRTLNSVAMAFKLPNNYMLVFNYEIQAGASLMDINFNEVYPRITSFKTFYPPCYEGNNFIAYKEGGNTTDVTTRGYALIKILLQ